MRSTPSFWAVVQLGAARQGDDGKVEPLDEVDEAVALGRLAALPVREHDLDVELHVVLLGARDDVGQEVAGCLIAAGGQPADPHGRRSCGEPCGPMPPGRGARILLAPLLREPRLPGGGVGVACAADAGDAAAGGPGRQPPRRLEPDVLDHRRQKTGGEQVAGAGHVDDLCRHRRHVQVAAAADQARPAAAHLADHERDAGVEHEVDRLGQRKTAEQLELGLGGEKIRAAVQQRQKALHALAGVDLAGVEGDLHIGGQPLEQRELRRKRAVAGEAGEVREPGLRQASRQVAGREVVVGARPHQVAAFAVLVEQHVDASGAALPADQRAVAGCQLPREELAVLVGAGPSQHGGPVAESRHGVRGVGRLTAAGAGRGDVREGFVDGPADAGVDLLFAARGPELLPQREGGRQAIDEIEVERAAADQIDRLHRRAPGRAPCAPAGSRASGSARGTVRASPSSGRPGRRRAARRRPRRAQPGLCDHVERLGHVAGVDGQDHAEAAVERLEQLVGGHAQVVQPAEDGSGAPGAQVELGREPAGHRAADVVGKAAAGDMRGRVHAAGVPEVVQHRAVDGRRDEQHVADRRAGARGRLSAAVGAERRVQVDAVLLHEMPHEAEAVAVQPARVDADERVAGRDELRSPELVALRDADGEAGHVEVAAGELPGVLGGLAAEQHALRLQAALVDAGHDVGDLLGLHLADHQVVEEEERDGAAGRDVVDAHRDKVDADGAELAHGAGDLDLGADAVGAGDEHGVLEPWQAHRAAKTAQATEDERVLGALEARLEQVDGAVARLDVDSRFFVRELVVPHRAPFVAR